MIFDKNTELPEDWSLASIKEIALIMSGQTPKGIENASVENGEIPWFRVGNMNQPGNEKILQISDVKLTHEKVQALKLHIYPKGTILFPKRGGAIATNKKRILGQPSTYDLNLMGILPIVLDNLYFWHWFESIDLKQLSDGSNVPQINHGDIEPLLVPLPPLNEQKRIVGKIEALQKRSQRVKEAIDAIPLLLDQFRQSVLAAAFRGDLTADWRENNPDVEPNFEKDSSPTSSLPTPIVIGEGDGSTPQGWIWIPLIDVAKLESGHTPRKSIPEYWEGGNVPWICLKDIRAAHGKIIHETLFMPTMSGIENSSARLLPEGTVCFSRDISVGFVTIMGRSMATTQHFANWICSSKLFNQYLMYAFMAARTSLIQSGEGTTVSTIYMPALKRMQILLPPFQEQQEIVRRIQSFFKAADVIKQQYQETKTNLDLLNQSILAKAFRGELVPQNPNDEPASILLERIRAEREKLQQQTKAAKQSKGKTTKRRSKKAPQQTEEAIQLELPGMEE